uniref:Uncharacterized protein n=1 Tax=Coturnix japonica TaxID=93934 RepID=A0A8C2T4P8_COTJA
MGGIGVNSGLFGLDLGLFGVDLGLFRVNLGLIWGRFGVVWVLGYLGVGFGVQSGAIWGQYGGIWVDLGLLGAVWGQGCCLGSIWGNWGSIRATSEWIQFFRDAGIPPGPAVSYAVTFVDNRIHKHMLLDLTKELMHDLGITLVGDVIAILKHAKVAYKQVRPQNCLKSPQNPPQTTPK